MFPEANLKGHALAQHAESVLLRPDGSPDIAAYAMRAHHERTAVIAASAKLSSTHISSLVS